MPDTIADGSPEPAAAIEIRLSRAQQLFNSLDPSPFHERDLDQDAEEYIVDSADESTTTSRIGSTWPSAGSDSISATGASPCRPDWCSYSCVSPSVSSCWPSGEAWRRRSSTRACTSSAGWPCGDPWRSSSTTGGRSGTARDSTPGWLGSPSSCARPEAVLRSRIPARSGSACDRASGKRAALRSARRVCRNVSRRPRAGQGLAFAGP